MNLLQLEAHKRFSDPVDTYDPLPAAPFTVTTLDPTNNDDNKSDFVIGLIHKLSQNSSRIY